MGPGDVPRRIREIAGQQALVGAVAIHQIQVGEIAVVLVLVVPGVGDAPPVGGGKRSGIGSKPVGERGNFECSEIDGMDLGVAPLVPFLGLEVPPKVEFGAVGRPPGIAVGFVARGDLPGRAAQLGVDDEDLRISLRIEAAAVTPPRDPIFHHGRRGQVCTAGKGGQLNGQRRSGVGDEHGERDHGSVR